MNSKKTTEQLNKALIDTYSLYLKTQICHWNVTGANFYSLHIMLEEHYKNQAEAVDELAERIRALGEKVKINFSILSEKESVEEEKTLQTSEDMLKHLIFTQELVIKQLDMLADIASENNDKITEDMAVSRLKTHGQQLWMLKSSL